MKFPFIRRSRHEAHVAILNEQNRAAYDRAQAAIDAEYDRVLRLCKEQVRDVARDIAYGEFTGNPLNYRSLATRLEGLLTPVRLRLAEDEKKRRADFKTLSEGLYG
jgi:hypothetical protein